jgi:signal transduction histidine kinase/GAF domain-containing protein
MDVLTELNTPAAYSDDNLLALIILRTVNLSLEHGVCDGSCYAFGIIKLAVINRFGDYDMAFRFGKLSLRLVDERGLARFKCRVYMAFAMLIPWVRPLAPTHALLERAFDAALEAGDLRYASYCQYNMVSCALFSGAPVAEVERAAHAGLALVRRLRFGMVEDVLTGFLRLARTLRGHTPALSTFADVDFDERAFEERLAGDPLVSVAFRTYHIRKQQALYLAMDHASALAAAERADGPVWAGAPYFELVEFTFQAALARAAAAPLHDGAARNEHLAVLTRLHQKLVGLAAHCADNLGSRVALITAELARLNGEDLSAQRSYEDAIRLSREGGFVQIEALAYELAARFYQARGFETFARVYRGKALEGYARWGAEGKVRQLEHMHPDLREQRGPLTSAAAFGVLIDQLDVRTVLKAAQALSSEIVLDTLIETLMRIAVEHAGAERGMLLLLFDGGPQLTAQAETAGDTVEVTLQKRAVCSTDLPASLLNYVLRTRESLILDDASSSLFFSDDEYVRLGRPRSVLCIPIIKQAKLVGVLYLENNLTPGAFTRDRLVVLEFLASQAAISLENATLYANLERSEALLAEGQKLSKTGTFIWNLATRKLIWSEQNYRNHGYDPSAQLTPSIDLILSRVHPEDRAAFLAAAAKGMDDNLPWNVDFRIVLPDGSVRHLHSTGRPLIDESGQIKDHIGSSMDVTALKRADQALRDAQADLMRVTRVTTIGELTASIAHEVNQPLTAIVNNGQACVRFLAPERLDLEAARMAAAGVVRDGHRVGDVIRSIRAMLVKSKPEIEPLDVNEVIRDVLNLMRGEFGRNAVSLETDLTSALDPIECDRVQLQQVILNLVLNAIEAVREVADRPRVVRVSTSREAAGGALVRVEDSGPGLDPPMMERIFEPFFTTKRDGMGIGLSICRTIVEAHGGRLGAMPHLPHGSVFQFTLPAVSALRTASMSSASLNGLSK